MDVETIVFLLSLVMFLTTYPISSGKNFSFLFFFLFILGLTFLYILVVVIRKVLEKKNPASKPFLKPLKKLFPMERYLDRDYEFNAAELCNRVSDWYVQIQHCRNDGDLSSIENIFSKSLFSNQTDLLNEEKSLGKRSCVADITNLDVILKGWYFEGGKDSIVVGIRADVYKFVENVATGEAIIGSKDHKVCVEYEWTLQRTAGRTTELVEDVEMSVCPKCNAPVKVGQSSRCPYCGAVLFTDNHDWVIADMEFLYEEPIKKK
jgi:hypothetical protein